MKKNSITLDFTDVTILFKILEGEGCVAIAEFLGINKQKVSARVARLAEFGLVLISDGTVKYHRNEYALSDSGKKMMMTMSITYLPQRTFDGQIELANA